MHKEKFNGLVGSIIQHRHSDRQAVLLSIDENVNGGLRVQWLTDKREISLPASDFDTILEEVYHVTL